MSTWFPSAFTAGLPMLVAKATIVLAAAAALDRLLRRRGSAAARHAVWTMAVIGLVALPVFGVALPSWSIAVTTAAPPATVATSADVASSDVVAQEPDAPAANTRATLPAARARQVRGLDWPAMGLMAYFVGVVVLLARLIAGQLAARRLAAEADEIESREWRRLLHDCAEQLALTREPRLLRSRNAVPPMTIGVRQPAIVLPPAADEWSEPRRRAVLLHELAHVARRDCLTQAVAEVAAAVYWVHPGAWWAARRLRIEREYACDDRVLAAGAAARDYAGHLLDIAYTLGGRHAPVPAVAMARTGQLEGRLLAVLDAARNRRVPRSGLRLAGSLAAVVLLAAVAAFSTSTPTAARALPMEPVDAPAPADTPQAPAPAHAEAAPAADESSTSGAWSVEPSERPGEVYLEMRQRHSSSGRTVQLATLEGLTASQMAGDGTSVRFALKRDAGTFSFEGTFRNGTGAGLYSFAPSATFAAGLASRGVGRPTPSQQYEMAKHDVGFALVDELKRLGYQTPTVDDLVRAGHHGVNVEFVHGMGELGYKVGTVEVLVRMRDHGVTPDYVQGLSATGLRSLSADDLVKVRDHGVTPDYVQGLSALGYQSLGMDALVNARDHGVTPDYVQALAAAGYTGLPLDRAIKARDHGISADYLTGMKELGFVKVPMDELVNARDHGVTPDYVRGLKALGYTPQLAELVKARDHGVTPDYAKGLRDLGYDRLSLDDLVMLRDHGVTADRAKRANDRAGTRLPPDMLRSLADGGLR